MVRVELVPECADAAVVGQSQTEIRSGCADKLPHDLTRLLGKAVEAVEDKVVMR